MKCKQNGVYMDLSFGFEIEGAFNTRLANNIDGEWKDDGSVDSMHTDFPQLQTECENDHTCEDCNGDGYIYNDCDCEPELNCNTEHEHQTPDCYILACQNDLDYHRVDCSYCDGRGVCGCEDESPAREFASEIYPVARDLVKDLELFDSKHYKWNWSCGLHLHIGVRDYRDQQKLRAIMCDYDLQRDLYELATTKMCNHQRERLLNHDYYCKFWDKRRALISSYTSGSDKYRFMNFHPQGTLEFRFLVPCFHKAQNVKKLLWAVKNHIEAKREFTRTVIEPAVHSKYRKIAKLDLNKNLNITNKVLGNSQIRLATDGETIREFVDGMCVSEGYCGARRRRQ